jgi:putative ABC transport system permease protein
MKIADILGFTWQALLGHRARSAMMVLAIVIGVSSVIVLTSLSESVRSFVASEFASLGTHLLIVIPGRSETKGFAPGIFSGETPRDLTLADANALLRSPGVGRVAPVILGSATVSFGVFSRDSPILGSTHSLLQLRRWRMAQGAFLPRMDIEKTSPICVIGANLRSELFGHRSPIGQWLRIGQYRFRVVGVLASEGRSIGLDVQDLIIIPAANAQMVFNTSSLFRIMVEVQHREDMERIQQDINTIITARHQGENDITVITQDAVLATFDKVFRALTLAVGGIAAISLAVAGVLIMNIMLIAVAQRTAEIGLLKALGASEAKVSYLFLTEALVLTAVGAAVGVMVGLLSVTGISYWYPKLLTSVPLWSVCGTVILALVIGLLFGTLPARRAAKLDPIIALAGK